jgi:hypothetical protein
MTNESANREGLRWLEALAEQYENTARTIRQTAMLIRQAELTDATRMHHKMASDESVQISEAVRKVLGGAMKPLEASEIWEAFKTTRISLRTRSSNPRSLLDTTLTNMEHSKQIRRTTEKGKRVKWVLAV